MTIEPRWLDRQATAAYLCVKVHELPRLVKTGKLPEPSLRFGPRTPRWDREKLDQAMGGQQARKEATKRAIDEAIASLALDPPIKRRRKQAIAAAKT